LRAFIITQWLPKINFWMSFGWYNKKQWCFWYSPLARFNSRNSAEDLVLTSFVPLHKLRHAKRACFYIRFNACASASWIDYGISL